MNRRTVTSEASNSIPSLEYINEDLAHTRNVYLICPEKEIHFWPRPEIKILRKAYLYFLFDLSQKYASLRPGCLSVPEKSRILKREPGNPENPEILLFIQENFQNNKKLRTAAHIINIDREGRKLN